MNNDDLNFHSMTKLSGWLRHYSEFTAFQSVAVNHVCHLLCELPGSKATGLDKISSKLIKLAS